MGKVTGFLEYERLEEGYEPVEKRVNTAQVSLEKVLTVADQADAGIPTHKGQADEALLKKLVEDHHRWTGSARARHILDHWADSRAKFVKVFPHEYRRALGEIHAAKEAASTIEQTKDPAETKAALKA